MKNNAFNLFLDIGILAIALFLYILIIQSVFESYYHVAVFTASMIYAAYFEYSHWYDGKYNKRKLKLS